VLERARTLAGLSRAPARYVERERDRLHQKLREIRASGRRRVEAEERLTARASLVLARKASAASLAGDRRRDLDRLLLALDAHDPQRTLERGYAVVEDAAGAPLTTAGAARDAGAVTLRFADGPATADVRPEEDP
jgi:exodeoxyribonuclease VII large subunit